MRIKSLERIEKNIEEFAILVDHIRNPLTIIAGTAELQIDDEVVLNIIKDSINEIEDVIRRLDKGWLESENVRKFLMRYMENSSKKQPLRKDAFQVVCGNFLHQYTSLRIIMKIQISLNYVDQKTNKIEEVKE
jgi:hypothetical protein